MEWSPDGARVAALTSLTAESEHSTYLWICNVHDDACMELKISSGESASLTWSPDGDRLFSCAHDQSVVCAARTHCAFHVCLAGNVHRRANDSPMVKASCHEISLLC